MLLHLKAAARLRSPPAPRLRWLPRLPMLRAGDRIRGLEGTMNRLGATALAVAVLAFSNAARAQQPCDDDAPCDGGLCLRPPGCGRAGGRCVRPELVPPGEYCGCDGRVFSRTAGQTRFGPWQAPERCGLDGGSWRPVRWEEQAWAVHYDRGAPLAEVARRAAAHLGALADQPERGHLLEPAFSTPPIQPTIVGEPFACAGATVRLAPPPGRRFGPADAGVRVYLGCSQELQVLSWSPFEVQVALPQAARSGCVSFAQPASEEDANLLRNACEAERQGVKLQPRGLGAAGARSCGVRCVERCARTNRLQVATPPLLRVRSFAGDGQPRSLLDGGRALFVAGQAHVEWESDAAVRVEAPQWAGSGFDGGLKGAAWLDGGQVVRFVSADRCGTAAQTLVLESSPALETQAQQVLQPRTPRRFDVTLPFAPQVPTPLIVTYAPGPLFPLAFTPVVRVEPGQRRVSVEVTSVGAATPGAKLGALSIAMAGYADPVVVPLQLAPATRGFADLHLHQFSDRAFGGAFVGHADGPIADALHECSKPHGPGGARDYVGGLARWASLGFFSPAPFWGHDTGGWKTFRGWPDALDYSHQQAFGEQLHRAWQGGLRLMVMLAVNNSESCGLGPDARQGCNDMDALGRQLKAAEAFAADGGQGWYVIVKSAAEARAAIEAQKLAVVLGAELDTLGDCVSDGARGKHCTPADVDQLVADLDDAGVRHVFPIHFATNGFGGSALFNVLTHPAEGSRPGDCKDEAGRDLDYDYTGAGVSHLCNRSGLTDAGVQLVQALMAKRFIIDIDHQSRRSRTTTLALAADAGYPLVAGHAWFHGLMKNGKRHEGTLKPAELEALRANGGMFGVLTNQADHRDDISSDRTAVFQGCGKSIETFAQAYLYAVKTSRGPIAFGSDLNGFAGQPAGRFGKRACVGGAARGWSPSPSTMLSYEDTTWTGLVLTRSELGDRLPYDINTDGFAHVGMYPDFIEALRKLGLSDADLDPLLTSADGYVRMWERIDALR